MRVVDSQRDAIIYLKSRSSSRDKLWTTIFVWGEAIVIMHLNVGICEAGEVWATETVYGQRWQA